MPLPTSSLRQAVWILSAVTLLIAAVPAAAWSAEASCEKGMPSLLPPIWPFHRGHPHEASPPRWWRGYLGVSGAGHALSASGMNRIYGDLSGVRADYAFWFTPHWALRADAGFVGGSGKVDLVDGTVRPLKNSMTVLTVPFMLEGLYRFGGGDWKRRAWPYCGIGFGTVESDERIELTTVGARYDTLMVRTDSGTIGPVFAVMAGYQFHVGANLHGVVEARMLQSRARRYHDLSDPNGPDEVAAYDEFSRIIRRPDYDVTGFEFSLGLCWGR